MHYAITKNDIDSALKIINNAPEMIFSKDQFGLTFCTRAVTNGHIELLQAASKLVHSKQNNSSDVEQILGAIAEIEDPDQQEMLLGCVSAIYGICEEEHSI